MSSGLLSIGSSGLSAAYTALETAGNNITNANTPGYSRQIVDFAAQVSTGLSGNYIGQGVAVTSITRAYNELLTRQVDSAQAAASQTGTRATLLNQVNNLFASTTSGLGAAVNQFFAQVQTLTQQPSNVAVRQSMLSSAQQMAATFSDAYAQLQQMQQGANQQIGQEISTVNSTTKQIAKLNDQIALASAAGGLLEFSFRWLSAAESLAGAAVGAGIVPCSWRGFSISASCAALRPVGDGGANELDSPLCISAIWGGLR